jgi:photosystem II stability/assembly factor-like uncharacterized protein
MKKLLLFSLICCLFFTFANSYSQWVQSGPEGGVISTLSVRSSGVIYAGTYKGIYFTSNFGDTWVRGNSNLDNVGDVISITFGTSDIYAIARPSYGSANIMFAKSTDNGYNFNTVRDINANVILANSSNVIFAGNKPSYTSGYDGSVSYSTNAGANWIQTNLSKTLAIYDLYFSGSTLYASGDSGVYSTTNSGSTWTKLSSGLPGNISVYSFKINGSDFYIGSNRGVYKSTNSGNTWTDITNGMPTVKPFIAIEIKDNIIFASNYSKGIYKSTNLGASWARCENGLKDLLINKFLIYGSYLFGASLGGGVYATADNAATWYPKNTGLKGHCVYTMINNGTLLYAGTQGGGVYYSNDGLTWIGLNSGLTNTVVYSLIYANSAYYAGTFGGIFKSTNNGNNWIAVNNGLLDSATLTLTSTGTSLFAGTQGGGLYKSDDWGNTWYKSHNGLTSDTVNVLAYLNSTLFAGTKTSGIFRSTNSGANWSSCNAGFDYIPYVLTFSAKGTNVYTGKYGTGGFYKSTNNGLNWTQILSNPGGSNNVLTSLVYNTSILVGIYALNGGTVLLSKNDGASWQDVSTGTSGNPNWYYTDVRSFHNYNGTFLVGTYGKSIYSVPFSQIIGIKQISSSVPDKFKLEQNYPNPFNPSTNIKYQIQKNSFVNLKVFDILGKEVTVLVDEKQSAGAYEVTFDAGSLNSGIYFYQLISGNFKETKKLLLVK